MITKEQSALPVEEDGDEIFTPLPEFCICGKKLVLDESRKPLRICVHCRGGW